MKRVVVIGIGIFGFNLVKALFDAGLEVMAIDKKKEAIQEVRDYCTKAILADGVDRGLLESLGIEPDDTVVVSFGEDLAASTLITLHLRQIGVKTIIVKAPNSEHKLVLESVGATEVIIPEKEIASKVARSLVSPNVLDFLPLSDEYAVCEVAPPENFIGKTLAEVHLRSKYHVDAIAIRDILTDKVTMVPQDYLMKGSEVLVVIGKNQDVEKFSRSA